MKILKNLFLRIISKMGCGESFEGVAVGADMYHQQNVKAFIGPYCNAEMDAVIGWGRGRREYGSERTEIVEKLKV